MRRILLFSFFAFVLTSTYGQLWFEDFTGENSTSGTASGSIGGTWSVTSAPSGGTFRGNDGDFRINGTGSEGTWSTNTINIASVGYAVIDISIIKVGVGLSAADYVRAYYSLDGGPEVMFAEVLGDFFSASTTIAVSAIVAGNSLRVIARGRDGSFIGYMAFDDVTVTAAPTIYSRKSGNWTDNSADGTWSLDGHTGSACGCVPLNSQVTVIGNSHVVSLSGSQTNIGVPPTANLAPGAVDVQSTGTLQYTASGATLGILKGLFRVRSGGVVNSSSAGITGEQISFNANIPGSNLVVDAGGNLTIEDFVIGSAATNTVYMSGGGNVNLAGNILVEADNSTLYNNITGTVNISNRLQFNAGVNDAQFVNNQPVTVNTIYFDDDDNTVTNYSSMTVTSLMSGSGDTDNSLINTLGSTLNLGAVSISGATDILNEGTINQTGNFTTVANGSAFTNQSTGTWNWSLSPNTGYSGNLTDALNCTATGNVFHYNGAGAQEILNETYYHLILSNSGNKSNVANLVVNGDLLIRNAAVLSGAAFSVDVGGDVTMQNNAVLGGTGNVNVAGNWSAVNAASYLQGTRTTTFDGTNQTITNGSGTEVFYNLTATGSGIKSSSTVFDVDNNLVISGSARLNLSTDLTVGGNWTVSSSNADPFVEGTRKVTFDGSGAQVITTSLGAGETFYDLDITGAGVKSNNSDINISRHLTIAGTATTQLSGSGDINITRVTGM